MSITAVAANLTTGDRVDVLILGHVTCDEIGGARRLGGAASFAARAAVILGLRAGLVTAAPAGAALLHDLRTLPGLILAVRDASVMTTFRLDYSGGRRSLELVAAAPPLEAADVPPGLRGAPVAYVGPVIGECGRLLVESLGAEPLVCVGLQGWLRRGVPGGGISPHLLEEALSPPANVRAAVVSDEDHPEAAAIAAALARQGLVVALTHGARGATILTASAQHEVPAVPATEVDPTGAGDVFGLVLAVGLARGLAPEAAARAAAVAAARVVEGPGIGTLARGTVSFPPPSPRP
jgi:sugar/nucleoside kinase (ribokinase family)